MSSSDSPLLDGLTAERAILDLRDSRITAGVRWINPAKARGTGDDPFQVLLEPDGDGIEGEGKSELFIKLRLSDTVTTTGVVTNSYSSSNDIDKGTLSASVFGYSGTIQSNATNYYKNETLGAPDTNSRARAFLLMRYRNFADDTDLSDQRAQDLSRWCSRTSRNSFHLFAEVDDDDSSWQSIADQGNPDAIVFDGTNEISALAIGDQSNGHPVFLHSHDGDGTLWSPDNSTPTGSTNARNQGMAFLLSRCENSASDGHNVSRVNSHLQNRFEDTGLSRTVFDQTEYLPKQFVLPKWVSLCVLTGGGCAWAYMTYPGGDLRDSNAKNYFLIK